MTAPDLLAQLDRVTRAGSGWIARCPAHEDRSPSLSVRQGDEGRVLLHCHAGCTPEGILRALGLKLADLFPPKHGHCAPSAPARTPKADLQERDRAALRAAWPLLETAGEQPGAMDALARLRRVSVGGVKLAAARGLLWLTAWKTRPAWVVMDGARVNAQARRMDGQPWPAIGKKAQTLPGSCAAWPIGALESEPFPVVLLVEGGPDLLAAHHFITAHQREADTAAVAMLGASNTIPEDALPLFAGKRVRVMAHADEAGRKAAAKWAEQLASVGAHVDGVDFTGLLKADGQPVKDLNDCTQLRPEDRTQLANLIPTNETPRP